jgi:hypothetical protein
MTVLPMHYETWTAEEFATLFDGTAREAASRFGRTVQAVENMRHKVLHEQRTGPIVGVREVKPTAPEWNMTLCPVHFLALPVSGACDYC